MRKILFAVMALALAFSAGAVLVQKSEPAAAQEATLDLPDLYEQARQSVVYIEVVGSGPTTVSMPNDENHPDEFFSRGLGSGFVWDTEGHIVTNYHVVGDAKRIDVTFFDGTFARAEVVGLDPDSDLAVIKVDVPAEKLVPVVVADSGSLEVGEPVIAIGNPFGQTWTMTTGIISALGRANSSLTGFSIPDMIQTDAAINPGNSGGPLFDAAGRVVGVNTQIISESRANSGVGFAVPSNTVQRVVPELIEDGDVAYTWIGIQGGSVSLDIIDLMNLNPDVRGVLISNVIDGGPASDADLQGADSRAEIDGLAYRIGGDIITAINGTPINTLEALVSYLAANTQPGDNVELTIIRDGETLTIPVLLEERPERSSR
ncbi:MAG: trypsin-like peptidase domain-containing protein [Anaerolineae bacterium]|nr:trypsin-like peptidase domain-containing protein [Anaerolineae bacterium]